MNVEMTILIRLNCSPQIAITPSTTYQLKNIGMNAINATMTFLNESRRTRSTKSEEIIRMTLKSSWMMETMLLV